jgi:hypothetical protein
MPLIERHTVGHALPGRNLLPPDRNLEDPVGRCRNTFANEGNTTMGRNPASFEKRRKEQARAEIREDKAKKRQQRRETERDRTPTKGDPDIDWIVPGPQAPAVDPSNDNGT